MCVSHQRVYHSTLKSREPDAFMLITSGHPITSQTSKSWEGGLSLSLFSVSLSLWNVFPCFVGEKLSQYNLCVSVCVCLEASEVTFLRVRATASSLR